MRNLGHKLLLVLLLFGMLGMFSVAHAWWDASWLYRKEITVNNSDSQNYTEVQIPINVTYNSHMNADFSDIRFTYYNATSNSETQIPYWIENETNSSWAYVWVKVPYLKASSSDNFLYIYYGNENATSESNATDVFIFFSDFDNSSEWNINDSTISISSGKLNYNQLVQQSTPMHSASKSINNITNCILETKIRETDSNNKTGNGGRVVTSLSGGSTEFGFAAEQYDDLRLKLVYGSDWDSVTSGTTISYDVDYYVTVKRHETSATESIYSDVGRTSQVGSSENGTVGSDNVSNIYGIRNYEGDNSAWQSGYIYYMFIRNYINTNPTLSFSNETAEGITLNSPTEAYIYDTLTYTITINKTVGTFNTSYTPQIKTNWTEGAGTYANMTLYDETSDEQIWKYTITAPAINDSSTPSKDYYYNIALQGSDGNYTYLTGSTTIKQIVISTTNTSWTAFAETRFKDESSLADITDMWSLATFDIKLPNGHTEEYALESTGNQKYYIDYNDSSVVYNLTIQYAKPQNGTDYPTRTYIAYDKYSTSYYNITLYSLSANDTDAFVIQLIDETSNPISGYTIHANRFYPSTNSYQIVSSGITNDVGSHQFMLEFGDVYYEFTIMDSSGNKVYTTIPMILEDRYKGGAQSYLIQIQTLGIPNFVQNTSISSNITLNSASSNIRAHLLVDSGTYLNFNMVVYEDTPSGWVNVGTSTGYGSDVIMLVNIPDLQNNYKVVITSSDDLSVLIIKYFTNNVSGSGFDITLIYLLFLASIAMVGALISPSMTIVVLILGMVAGSAMGALRLSEELILSIIAAGIFIYWWLKR